MQLDIKPLIVKNILNVQPHQLNIDHDCGLGRNIYYNCDDIYSKSSSICARNNVCTGRSTGFNITGTTNLSTSKLRSF